ncbi:magnesium/cobalt transporter CorA [Hymenobacter properus]|uniref:Magnesium transport protein CorA n=1 Tax=Hymenobacter properus TaxID=2791026 RepID=A0A931BD72_9BACT|nr:magnesium/cobalt transporter CorA [Hymenobacter properus]MBF9140132.1 magnesium/cobalt transporter CorA [Hymenobacter properus]MBR7718939.1 magnesium/cobalt transporter CorA [Microvirga sp. SRT04]
MNPLSSSSSAAPNRSPTLAEAPGAGPISITDREATRQARYQQVGQRPGTLNIREGALKPRLFLVSYNDEVCAEDEYTDRYDDLLEHLRQHPELKHWIDVRGYGDLPLMERLMQDFGLHPLQMEDVLNDYQRAKIEVFDDHRLFMVSRMTDFTALLEIDDDQLSIFTGPNYVLTFQDDYDDCLDTLRVRIRANFSTLRRHPSLYLAYALTDVVLDHYYPTMAAIGDYIEELEEAIFADKRPRRLLNRILRIKKDVVRFRRLVYPERDKIAEILRLPEEIMPETLKIFYRDAYDHAIQALDLAESYRDNISSLTDLYLSDQSNRMNEVMKVLTIISTIFIPLSFVVGLYGMNFQRHDDHGHFLAFNMPELYSPWGYPMVLGIMALVVGTQLYYFYRKGWLTNR